ncbi:MAG: hypothetical protein A3H72_01260 [Candidatus Doudnabacteria bacterium RIFCSPLOWO2_02_FULL_48_8]|uniref:Four helix bundle protein n=1 Tax=Candidatus Doudnabacteria bacterium RIFCSPHIGHO2_01_FULL_46_24 TaxID=1817825 RepID=A0A1F5NUV1_9BACT|nr:MAG: hypothetical protein A2720_02810 [Candidatus Doudnabacteria bacterium RIFCSPHIGHO2_01_FULL_46_24]OGE95026.1 MAG: hypothetical protein A3H72_01260 [Candidatus Doudnabacteria bacterium RIFCSPLOWO2_02_FULL_48_8]OGE95934.1 MAG: hypothetical protein A3E98_00605 [Candidatus Doudnabacteria bacterium RIFCSPHIGHO2_12_FULL_48_11]
MQNSEVKSKIDTKTRAYNFALEIIKLIKILDQRDLSCQVLSKQVLRSATSIGANIIEAQAGRTRKDFANFFTHALKSANETKFWLGLMRDANLADKNKLEVLLKEVTELSNILAASILTLKKG